VHGQAQVARRAALDQVGEAAGLLGLLLQGRALEGGEQDDLDVRAGVLDQPGGVEAAQDRHAQVHQDHVGLQLLGQGDRVGAVGGLAGDLEAGLDEQVDQGRPEHRVVVGDQQPGPAHAPGPSAATARGSLASTTVP
jgi:hypothetical protein